jgi:phosphoribosylamine--glycine ligase
MNILLIGSGGREHAFAQAISKSNHCSKLFTLPGNSGTRLCGINVPLNPLDFAIVGKFCIDNEIRLIVVGPEEPLVKGMRDYFEADDILKQIIFIGPGERGAMLEGSKDFSKQFMHRHGIPTAAYQTFDFENFHKGIDYVNNQRLPIVLKADGLAAGKGVLICETHQQATDELQQMIKKQKFGIASSKVVVETFLDGIELSVFVLTDGKQYKILPEAKDYKRIGVGDKGLNTGGMGAISPVPFANKAFMQKVEERIVKPTVDGLQKDNINYVGFIFIGLMNVDGEPYVIEYNCRMGDPETEVVIPRIHSDMVELLMATGEGRLNEITLQVDSRKAATVMLVSGGYPEEYEKGKIIQIPNNISTSNIYHAGIELKNDDLITVGGRVLAITSLADTLKDAVEASMQLANTIQFDGKYFRTDIGHEFI